MFRLFIASIWIITCSVLYSPKLYPVFGVKVSVGANSQITSFACFMSNGHTLTKKKVVDKETFVKIVTGYWPSIYNPERVDFFAEHDIDCAIYKDSITQKPLVGCVPIDSLWKIRFSTYPFRHMAESGWSNKYHKPSPAQEKYLYNRYGVHNVDAAYFLDTNFWMIMNDVTDPLWIANYRSLH